MRLTAELRNTSLLLLVRRMPAQRPETTNLDFWGGLVAKVASHDPQVDLTRRL